MRRFVLGILILLFCACGRGRQDFVSEENRAKELLTGNGRAMLPPFDTTIAKGFILPGIGDVENCADCPLTFYNADGTVWKTIIRDYEAKTYTIPDFKPYYSRPGYWHFLARCVGERNGYYKVVVNEKSLRIKYVKNDDYVLEFYSWESLVRGMGAVEWNPKNNPLLEKPNRKAKPIPFDFNTHSARPWSTEGDWLQVKWMEDGAEKYGWVRWRRGKYLILKLYYTR